MRVPKCQTCNGSGWVVFTRTHENYYDVEDSVAHEEVCDECGGTGKDLTVVAQPHPHHENTKAKERWV